MQELADSQRPDLDVILEGVTGSVAYGLNHEGSDVDIKGVYVLPTRKVLELNFNPNKTTVDHADPDYVYHEVAKFMKLVASGNPTVNEMLYLDSYTKLSPAGKILVENRSAFLSTKSVLNSYRGYALSQAKKLNNRTGQGLESYDSGLKNRFSKHTRHLARLLWQAEELLTTGSLTVKLNQAQRDFCFQLGESSADEVVNYFMEQDTRLESLKSVLPNEPDLKLLNGILYEIRTEGEA